MDSFTDFANLRETLWYIIMIGLLFYIIIAINIAYIHSQIERKAKQMPARLKTMSLNLKTIGVGLMKDNSDITGREKDQVVEEVKRYPTSGKQGRRTTSDGLLGEDGGTRRRTHKTTGTEKSSGRTHKKNQSQISQKRTRRGKLQRDSKRLPETTHGDKRKDMGTRKKPRINAIRALR